MSFYKSAKNLFDKSVDVTGKAMKSVQETTGNAMRSIEKSMGGKKKPKKLLPKKKTHRKK